MCTSRCCRKERINLKKSIKIKFVDFYKGFDKQNNEFVEVLSKKYNVIQTDKPDYVIYSCFGYEHLKYDCIRIFYTGECITPNFNECDYAIGFDRLEFNDRYIRIPLHMLFQYKKDYLELQNRPLFTEDDLKCKNEFCSFVYSNCFAQDKRTEMFEKLSHYKKVNSGGRYRNNIGGAVADKKEFQSKHKFSIAFENTSYDGYATEKIVEAFAARTIPIYYGDPRIAEDFNPKSFINCHDYASLDDVIMRVKEIDCDDNLYLEMINEQPLINVKDAGLLCKFLFHIFDQEYKAAFRRPRSLTTLSGEKAILRHSFYETRIHNTIQKIHNQIIRMKRGTMLSTKRKK